MLIVCDTSPIINLAITLLDRLIEEADFFIHENLYYEVKVLAGE